MDNLDGWIIKAFQLWSVNLQWSPMDPKFAQSLRATRKPVLTSGVAKTHLQREPVLAT